MSGQGIEMWVWGIRTVVGLVAFVIAAAGAFHLGGSFRPDFDQHFPGLDREEVRFAGFRQMCISAGLLAVVAFTPAILTPMLAAL